MAVGVGWNFAEYEGVGADFTTRGKRLDEQIQLMRRLWSEPLVTFAANGIISIALASTPCRMEARSRCGSGPGRGKPRSDGSPSTQTAGSRCSLPPAEHPTIGIPR